MEGLPGSGESFADDYLPHLLTRAAQAADAEFEAELRQLRVQRPVWWALAVLSEAEATTVTELANRCALQQPTATKLVDRMEQQGLVCRKSDERDRRFVRVALTTKGGAVAGKLVDAAKRHEAALLPRYPRIEDAKEVLRAIIADNAKALRNAR